VAAVSPGKRRRADGAILCALVGAAFLLHESSSSTWTIVISVLISGFLALGVGLVMVLFGMQFLPRLSLKVGGSYLVGSLVAIITILYTPLVMFKHPGDANLLILLLLCFLIISLVSRLL
jgi:ABC-type Na+ efflux pump permease subunit